MIPSLIKQATSTPYRRLVGVLGLTSMAGIAMSAFRAYYGGTLGYASLPWDLFLAWVPIVFAFAVSRAETGTVRQWAKLLILAFFWLLFFPNSPYLVTEFIHLYGSAVRVESHLPFGWSTFSPRGGIPAWFDVVLISTYAWTGLLLGFLSLHLIHRTARRLGGPACGWLVVVIGTGLCAFGISLGRFERWNSWDLFASPLALLSDVLSRMFNPFAHPRTSAVTILLSAFLLLGYLSIVGLMQLRLADDERTA